MKPKANKTASEEEQTITAVKADITLYRSLDAFNASEAGKSMKAEMLKDIGSSVDALTSGYKTLPHIELLALIAQLEGRIDLLRAMNRSTANAELAEEYLNALIA